MESADKETLLQIILNVGDGKVVEVDEELWNALEDRDFVEGLLFSKFVGRRAYSVFSLPPVFMSTLWLTGSTTASVAITVGGLFVYVLSLGKAAKDAEVYADSFFAYRDSYRID